MPTPAMNLDLAATCMGTVTNDAEYRQAMQTLADAVGAGIRASLLDPEIVSWELRGVPFEHQERKLIRAAVRVAFWFRPTEVM